MNRAFPSHQEFESDDDDEEDLIEDYDETQGVPKKNWVGPAQASLQQLERVKPVATVYNIGLRDPTDLKPGRGKSSLLSTNDVISELKAEPPLSTVSYQKAAWGSETSIPDILKQAAQAGLKPGSRPSSAKVGGGGKPLLTRKCRPQSAKDPLCPNGKTSAALGIKGQKFDPSDRYARNGLPSDGLAVGWAGPPAGMCDPSGDTAIASAELQKPQGPLPPAPNCSPVPSDTEDIDADSRSCSPALHLSLSLPSADVDADEPDTSRLLEEADQYVKAQKKKAARKIKLFKADAQDSALRAASPAGTTPMPHSLPPQQNQGSAAAAPLTGDEKAENLGGGGGGDRSSQSRMERIAEEEGFISDRNNNRGSRRHGHQDGIHGGEESRVRELALGKSSAASEASLRLDLASGGGEGEGEGEFKPLPPSNGFDLEYLGPTSKQDRDRRARQHPFFHKTQKQAERVSPDRRPQSAKDRTDKFEESPESRLHSRSGRGSSNTGTVHPHSSRSAAGDNSDSHARPTTAGVHIREDRNMTLHITPRNQGRKVRKHRGSHHDDDALSDLENNARHQTLEMAPTSSKIGAAAQTPSHHNGLPSASAAAMVSVVYDDDDGSQRKGQKRRGPVKERDLVTLVSNVSLSDEEEEDDPSREMGRSPSALSNSKGGERNYYDVARKQAKHERAATTKHMSLEEKENFITMTTKLILFDTEKPMESVVKTILEAPAPKVKDTLRPPSVSSLQRPATPARAAVSPDKPPPARPKSSARPRSAKLTTSEFYSMAPVMPPPPHPSRRDLRGSGEGDGGFAPPTSKVKVHGGWEEEEEEEERPSSRRGHVSMATDLGRGDQRNGLVVDDDDGDEKGEAGERPDSGGQKPLSVAGKAAASKPPILQRARESETRKVRPMSASSAVGRLPSAAEMHRANAAAQALRSLREATAKTASANNGAPSTHATRHYASYSNSSSSGGRRRERTASLTRSKPIEVVSNDPNMETSVPYIPRGTVQPPDTEQMEKCKQMQNRLACYGIDVNSQTLERALYPPSGRTLHYQVDAQLPTSYSNNLLSHPRYWLPKEHRNLKIAEKKLAQAELSLWRQKKEEERKAKLAAGKVTKKGKKGKKKGKKKLLRPQSAC